MIFDLFHSISDPVINGATLGGHEKAFHGFLKQVQLAESFGMDTVWLAESHFSSEVQKRSSDATIKNFEGEVGLNSDSFQLIHWLQSRTKRIHFGTGIHNIVGGSGGPIASADRVNSLRFYNRHLWETPRQLRIGVASGRFSYQNSPFGIRPRNELEHLLWPQIKRYVFLEAFEVFLRLVRGETISSADVSSFKISEQELSEEQRRGLQNLVFPITVASRWNFEALKIVPEVKGDSNLHIVLGSSDPAALDTGYPLWDLDLFNLSFTPPDQIEGLHGKMSALANQHGRKWNRSRLPRTVLVFIDPNSKKAKALANASLDTYIEAMRGTATVPDKAVLLQRALVGDASEIRDQLSPANPRRFHPDDRLMLWFEFNQQDPDAICRQMGYFFERVIA